MNRATRRVSRQDPSSFAGDYSDQSIRSGSTEDQFPGASKEASESPARAVETCEPYLCAVLGDAEASAAVDAVAEAISDLAPIKINLRGRWPAAIESVHASVVICVVQGELTRPTLLHIEAIRRHSPATIILVTSVCAPKGVIAMALDAGASDYLSFPPSEGEWMPRLHRAIGLQGLHLRDQTRQTPATPIRGFLCASARSQEVGAKIADLAACDSSVLIVGETGSGKEICAQAIHYKSRRAGNSLVAVNCGAVPSELVENELFGHAKGAYTMAHSARPGLVLEAENGTLFLDDVDCLPLMAQAKLLRFLQEREYRAVGSNAVVRANVRVLAASNRDLKALAACGQFRQDLYYRLNVLRLNLPALRERREDIVVLAMHFIGEFAREFDRPVSALTPAALRVLLAYAWPGNVRELRHVIERAVLACRGPALFAEHIDIDDDMAGGQEPAESFSSAKARLVREFERNYLQHALELSHGNVAVAAQAAKKDRRAFFELLRKHAIEPRHFRSAAG